LMASAPPSPRVRGPSLAAVGPCVDNRNGRRQTVSKRAVLRNAVVVSSPIYCLCWWMVLALHASAAVFVWCSAFVHFALSLPAIHANTPSLLLTIPLKRVAGLSYLGVALLHVQAVAKLLYASARAGRFLLQREPRGRRSQSSHQHLAKPPTTRRHPIHPVHEAYAWCHGTITHWVGYDGYFGLNSPFFHLTVLVREIIEIFLQSYQLWTLSASVARVWINTLAVAVVAINCWSIPLVMIVFHRRERTRRLMHLVADMYLDYTCAVLIPVCVMIPYLQEFDWINLGFSLTDVANDVWLANAIAEARYVLVSSYADLAASLLPQYSVYACLRLLKRLVVRSSPPPSIHVLHHPNRQATTRSLAVDRTCDRGLRGTRPAQCSQSTATDGTSVGRPTSSPSCCSSSSRACSRDWCSRTALL
jgi:hypothetical protein